MLRKVVSHRLAATLRNAIGRAPLQQMHRRCSQRCETQRACSSLTASAQNMTAPKLARTPGLRTS